jgi:hypothetical protein
LHQTAPSLRMDHFLTSPDTGGLDLPLTAVLVGHDQAVAVA